MQIQVPAATNVMMSTSWIDPHHLIHPCPRHKKVGCFFLYISIFSYGISLKLAYSINNLDSFFLPIHKCVKYLWNTYYCKKGSWGFQRKEEIYFYLVSKVHWLVENCESIRIQNSLVLVFITLKLNLFWCDKTEKPYLIFFFSSFSKLSKTD